MDTVGAGWVHVIGVGVFAVMFLAPIHGFLAYRLHRARTRERPYVPQSDPWVSAVVAVAGLAALVLLRWFA